MDIQTEIDFKGWKGVACSTAARTTPRRYLLPPRRAPAFPPRNSGGPAHHSQRAGPFRSRFPPRTPVRESREQRILDGQLGWGIRATLAGSPFRGTDAEREVLGFAVRPLSHSPCRPLSTWYCCEREDYKL